MEKKIYNCIFDNYLNSRIVIKSSSEDKIYDLINLYFQRKEKSNLIVNNLERTYFINNGHLIDYENKEKTVGSLFGNNLTNTIAVFHLDYSNTTKDIKEIKIIKDSQYTTVSKAEIKNFPVQYVAVKKIKKNQLKEDIKENNCVDEITDEDFLNEIIKFNRELENMKICHCQNSVEIYDYFDTKEEFIIIMELCDNNLFKVLAKIKNGFDVEKIKNILLQLNNAFKIMNEHNIAHRDIKLHNILVKFLNKKETEFKVLISDFGVSNQLNSMTGRYKTHAGTQMIMAPEILEGKKYTNKCDLWSLGISIFQLYTKKPPYSGKFDNEILQNIKDLGQSVLDVIKDAKLKDLLSKLLVSDPNKRISWEEYFNHSFFK